VLPERLTKLVRWLTKLPGVGEKTAQRYALYLVADRSDYCRRLSEELAEVASQLRPCERCGHVADLSDGTDPVLCSICRDNKRDAQTLCVVARIQDLLAIEKSGAMRGRYFVLGKLLSPLEGVAPDDLPVSALSRRITEEGVREVVIATPPSVDGEATALYLARELSGKGLVVTRIASGVPHGGDLEFADEITLGRAIEGRKAL
jgi:recombination protein RecR